MSNALPAVASKANCDAGTDDPEQALLVDLAQLIDKFNALIASTGLSTLALMAVGAGLEQEVSGGGVADKLRTRIQVQTKAAGYTAVAADRGTCLNFTTAGVTLALTAAATLTDGWYCFVRNSAATGNVTIDPNASQTIDGATTITLTPGEACLVICNGSLFTTVGRDTLRNINALTAETVPATGDEIAIYDVSAGAVRKMTRANFIGSQPFSDSYDSGNLTITSAGLQSLAHGMGVVPKLVVLILKNVIAELGYSVNDELLVNSTSKYPGGFAVTVTSTTIAVRYSSESGIVRIQRKDNGASDVIVNGNWRLIVRAYA